MTWDEWSKGVICESGADYEYQHSVSKETYLRLWQRTGTWGAFTESVADHFICRDLPDRNLLDQVVDSPVMRGYFLQTRWLVIRGEMAPLGKSIHTFPSFVRYDSL